MSSPAEVATWRLVVLAAALTLPLFIILEGASVTLPDSFYEVSGIPVHSSALLFVLLPKKFLKSRTELLFLLVYLTYCGVALIDSGERLQTVVQLGYFIYAYKILDRLNPETVRILNRYIAIIGSAFIFVHAIAITHAYMRGDILSASANVFGFVIYQSHLTYPIILIMILMTFYRSFSNQLLLKFILIAFVMLIELVLMRRVGFGLFIIFILLFERRYLIFFALIILAVGMVYADVLNFIFEQIPDLGRLAQIFSGANQRTNAWQTSLDYLNQISVVLMGNGLNNYSHNFFLHTITTHGFAISALFIVPIFYYVYKMVKKIGILEKTSLLVIAIIIVDWSVNVNIYQPYYAAMFALILVSAKASSRERDLE